MKKNEIPKTICSIDASTNSIAFAIYTSGKLVSHGKLSFSGENIYKKSGDAARKTSALFKSFPVDVIVIEKTIFANSPAVAADLALSQGALIGGATLSGIDTVYSVAPISWQSYIGNPLLKKDERDFIKSSNPGKSLAWYKTKERETRKNRTIDIVNKKFSLEITDNDIADAIGVGMFALDNWEKVSKK